MLKKAYLHIGSTLLFLAIVLHRAYPQGDIWVHSRVDRAKITIGDRIRYSVIVKRTPDVKVEMPSLAVNLGMFEISDYEVYEPFESRGMRIDSTDYSISTFETGEFEIPPLAIHYSIGSDTTRRVLHTEAITIHVESLNPDQEGDIRGLKGPLEIPQNWARIIRFIAAGFLGIFAIVLLFLVIRRYKQGKGLIPKRIKPPRPPHEIALEELDALMSSDLLARGAVKQFYSELSDIIRRYIEGRFYITALEMTTSQLVGNMRAAEIEGEHCSIVQQFLELCDLVKFAKYAPDSGENERAAATAYDFVNRSKLVIAEEFEEELSKNGDEELAEVKAEAPEFPVADAEEAHTGKGGDAQ